MLTHIHTLSCLWSLLGWGLGWGLWGPGVSKLVWPNLLRKKTLDAQDLIWNLQNQNFWRWDLRIWHKWGTDWAQHPAEHSAKYGLYKSTSPSPFKLSIQSQEGPDICNPISSKAQGFSKSPQSRHCSSEIPGRWHTTLFILFRHKTVLRGRGLRSHFLINGNWTSKSSLLVETIFFPIFKRPQPLGNVYESCLCTWACGWNRFWAWNSVFPAFLPLPRVYLVKSENHGLIKRVTLTRTHKEQGGRCSPLPRQTLPPGKTRC